MPMSGEVVPLAGGEQPFEVVFTDGETILQRWPVDSVAQGKAEIEVLTKIGTHIPRP